VDFYVLQDESQSADSLACMLALMAWEKGHRITVVVESDSHAAHLDEHMWQHPDGRFLPHERANQGGAAPVSIGTMAELHAELGEVVINLSQNAVPDPARFQRLLELVPANDAQRKSSRDKFRAYRNLGLQPASHSINRN